MVYDRFLHDFSSAWPGPKDETGLRDQDASQQYYEAFLKAQKQDNAQQGQFYLENSGLACFLDPDTGNLIMQGQMGQCVIAKADLSVLVAGVQGKKPPKVTQPPGSSPNQVSGAGGTSSDLSPQLKKRMQDNLRNLEAWAIASSKSWPK
jgi:hypothetical protein